MENVSHESNLVSINERKRIGEQGLKVMSQRNTETKKERERWEVGILDTNTEVGEKRKKPGKDTATVTGMAPGATGFDVGFVVGLNCIAFGALVTNPLLVVAVLPPEVLLYSHKVPKGMARVMVQATWLRTHKHPLLLPLRFPL
ncbi:hypothetical protein CR513_17741, partial [Mucuna pruriens]